MISVRKLCRERCDTANSPKELASLRLRTDSLTLIARSQAGSLGRIARQTARGSVAEVLDLRTENSAVVSHEKVFDAWYAMSESSNKRRDAKNIFYSTAVLVLVLELVFLVMALTTGTGPVVSG